MVGLEVLQSRGHEFIGPTICSFNSAVWWTEQVVLREGQLFISTLSATNFHTQRVNRLDIADKCPAETIGTSEPLVDVLRLFIPVETSIFCLDGFDEKDTYKREAKVVVLLIQRSTAIATGRAFFSCRTQACIELKLLWCHVDFFFLHHERPISSRPVRERT